MIAFLGMGHLGANFVKALLRNGHQVQVWNRTYEKASALEADGAKPFQNIEDAVKGADRVHITLKDDASVDEMLAKAAGALKPGCFIIDHTTTSVEGAVERTQNWAAKGFTYVHAPVFMGPQNALESTGTMLVSGNQDTLSTVTPMLDQMTGKVLNFGDTLGRAAGMKLLGNMFLIAVTGGLSDCLALAKSLNIPFDNVHQLFGSWNPAAMIPARLNKITSESFDQPTWELHMARKDARLMVEAAQKGDMLLHVIPSVAALMDEWIAKGFSGSDWTIIGKV